MWVDYKATSAEVKPNGGLVRFSKGIPETCPEFKYFALID